MSVVIGIKFHMKLYITKYMSANFVCRIIDIQDGHFKIQHDCQVSWQYQFHRNPYIIKCMCANLGYPVVNIF